MSHELIFAQNLIQLPHHPPPLGGEEELSQTAGGGNIKTLICLTQPRHCGGRRRGRIPNLNCSFIDSPRHNNNNKNSVYHSSIHPAVTESPTATTWCPKVSHAVIDKTERQPITLLQTPPLRTEIHHSTPCVWVDRWMDS